MKTASCSNLNVCPSAKQLFKPWLGDFIKLWRWVDLRWRCKVMKYTHLQMNALFCIVISLAMSDSERASHTSVVKCCEPTSLRTTIKMSWRVAKGEHSSSLSRKNLSWSGALSGVRAPHLNYMALESLGLPLLILRLCVCVCVQTLASRWKDQTQPAHLYLDIQELSGFKTNLMLTYTSTIFYKHHSSLLPRCQLRKTTEHETLLKPGRGPQRALAGAIIQFSGPQVYAHPKYIPIGQ